MNYGFIAAAVLLVSNIVQFFILMKNRFSGNGEQTIDPLTKLGNKGAFDKALDAAINEGNDFYLLYCDLDNFKQLNDTLGHKEGDDLLKLVAKTWKKINVCEHEVYRQGGDEFSVITKANHKKVEELAKTMVEELNRNKPKEASYITSSIGIAQYPIDADNSTDLRKYADATMYEAKNSGKNQYKFFTNEIYNKIMTEFLLEKKAVELVKNNNFTMLYQPQWNIRTHELVGFESLIRSENTDTQSLILAAENNGTIFDLDLNIFRKVLEDTVEIVKRNPKIVFSINVSGKHISLPNFYTQIYDIMSEYDYPAQNLKFEITETSAVKNIGSSLDKVKKLKRLGIKIALDDFGIGFSNLQYLINLNVDSLKIDKSFVDVMHKDGRFVQFVINLAHTLKCDAIAEGVETHEQLEQLRVFTCDYIQGFIWGKPLSLEETKKLIETC